MDWPKANDGLPSLGASKPAESRGNTAATRNNLAPITHSQVHKALQASGNVGGVGLGGVGLGLGPGANIGKLPAPEQPPGPALGAGISAGSQTARQIRSSGGPREPAPQSSGATSARPSSRGGTWAIQRKETGGASRGDVSPKENDRQQRQRERERDQEKAQLEIGRASCRERV